MVHCDNELRYRTRIDWNILDCFALAGRTYSIVSYSQGGAVLCCALGFGVKAFQASKTRL